MNRILTKAIGDWLEIRPRTRCRPFTADIYIYFKISSAHYPFVYPSTLQTPVTIYETARCSWLFINCDLLKPEAHAVANRTIH